MGPCIHPNSPYFSGCSFLLGRTFQAPPEHRREFAWSKLDSGVGRTGKYPRMQM